MPAMNKISSIFKFSMANINRVEYKKTS